MKARQIIKACLLVLLLVFISFNFIFLSGVFNPQDNYTISDIDSEKKKEILTENDEISPLSSFNGQTPLNYSNIWKNVTRPIRRYFEAINFTVNVSGYANKGVNKTKIQILFNDGTTLTEDMTPIGNQYNNTWTHIYNSTYTTPLGFHEVRFLVYNETIQLNTGTTHANFTIISNALASLNSTTLHRGNTLKADISVNESIDSWQISIVDDNCRTPSFERKMDISINPYQVIVEINSSYTVNKYYYIKINSTSGTKWIDEYFRFFVENTPPTILTSTVRFSSNSIFRTKSTTLSLNISDNEDSPSSLTVSAIVKDPEGGTETIVLGNNNDGSFEGSISVGANQPKGTYDVEISAEDSLGINDTYHTDFEVKNNPPKIYGFKINNQTLNTSLTVQYGELLTFTFNISDVEGIAFVTVALLNTENEYFNITREYVENLNITVRTVDLSTGAWYVYVNVTDTDGVNVGLSDDYLAAPQEIIIEPNVIEEIFPISMFIIGLSFGTMAGIGVAIGFFKTRFLKKQEVLLAEEKKKELLPTKKKAVKKKREKPGKKAEKKPKEETLEEKGKPPEEEKEVSKKRIRRKL
ncbi:MAG: hypothetical protein ACTSXH_07375 [Promethearchaeota archaeon]